MKLALGAYDGCWLVFDPQNHQGDTKREDSAAEVQEIRVAWTVRVNPAAQQLYSTNATRRNGCSVAKSNARWSRG